MLRGEIYFVDLDPVRGREQGGTRPVLVVSLDAINRAPLVVTIIPGTDGANVRRDYPTNIRLSAAETGLRTETVFLGFQLRALDPGRFPPRPSGQVSPGRMRDVEDVVRYCLGL